MIYQLHVSFIYRLKTKVRIEVIPVQIQYNTFLNSTLIVWKQRQHDNLSDIFHALVVLKKHFHNDRPIHHINIINTQSYLWVPKFVLFLSYGSETHLSLGFPSSTKPCKAWSSQWWTLVDPSHWRVQCRTQEHELRRRCCDWW